MAKKSFSDLRAQVQAFLGEAPSDEGLTLLEDINDTLADGEDWRTRYEDNDRNWRARYAKRFSDGPLTPEGQGDGGKSAPDPSRLRISDLFTPITK